MSSSDQTDDNEMYGLSERYKLKRKFRVSTACIENVKNEIELFEYFNGLYNNEFHLDCIEKKKSDNRAKCNINFGNLAVSMGDYRSAINYFTSGVLSAENTSYLSLAYLKRSNVLLHLGLPQECLSDIDRAISHNYPLDSFVTEKQLQARNKTASTKTYHDEVPTIETPHPTLPNASDCIEMKINEKYGRHIVATRDIKIGEILLVEKPLVSMILKNQRLHCHECTRLCYNLIPCEMCGLVSYCGDDCKKNAADFHRFECEVIIRAEAIWKNSSHYVLLPLKLAFMIMEDEELLNEISNLQNHFTNIKISAILKIMERVIHCYSVLKNCTNYFKSEHHEQKFKTILTKSMFVAHNNCRYITKLDDELDKVDIGSALYSTLNYFNHSCCPNVTHIHYGTTAVLRAVKSIKKGEQCFICYTWRYEERSLEKRQIGLKNLYCFECKCKACLSGWPIDLQPSLRFPNKFLGFRNLATYVLESESLDFLKKNLDRCIRNFNKIEKSTVAGIDRAVFVRAIEKCFAAFGNRPFDQW